MVGVGASVMARRCRTTELEVPFGAEHPWKGKGGKRSDASGEEEDWRMQVEDRLVIILRVYLLSSAPHACISCSSLVGDG